MCICCSLSLKRKKTWKDSAGPQMNAGYWPDKSLDRRTCVAVIYSFKEILIFNYLIIMRDNIHVSKRKKNWYKTRQISGWEIPGSRKFPRYHLVLSRLHIIMSSTIFFTLSVPSKCRVLPSATYHWLLNKEIDCLTDWLESTLTKNNVTALRIPCVAFVAKKKPQNLENPTTLLL